MLKSQTKSAPAASTPASSLTRRIGTMLKGKWRLETVLGSGGMAVVYQGVHRNGHRAAIEILHPHVAADERYRRRFLREAYAANKVGHPNVPRIVDDDVSEDGSAFLVMDLLVGESLKNRQREAGGTLHIAEALDAAEQVLEIFVAAHAQGIVHRDIKPDNLFRTRDGRVHVLDFGIAAIRDTQAIEGLTQSGHSMGTHGYMAPEQARGRWAEVDARTDLFALGATVFTLLTGRRVHEAETQNEVLLKEMTERAEPVSVRCPELAPAIAAWLDRSLAFRKDDRWASAQAMLEALESARGGAREAAPGPEKLPPPAPSDVDAAIEAASTTSQEETLVRASGRRPWIVAAVAVAAVGLIGAISFARSTGRAPATTAEAVAPSIPPASAVAADESASAMPDVAPTTSEPPAPTARASASRAPPTKAAAAGAARRPAAAPPKPRASSTATLLDKKDW